MDENIKHPKISVVMPVYNGEKYLVEAIDSILNQTYSDFELLLINDGSKDATESIILSYSDERIVYVKNEENLGLIKTLNKGIDLARGEFIARMDQDDISHQKRFEKQIKIFEENNEVGVCGTWFTMFGGNIDKILVAHPERSEEIKLHLLGHCTLGHPTIMLRKSSIGSERYDEDYQAAEDYDFWVRLSKITELYNIPESLLDYRMHDSNMTVLEGSIQFLNSDNIRARQLRELGIHHHKNEVQYCVMLFTDAYIKQIKFQELKKIIKFANNIEQKNSKKNIYNQDLLQKAISKRLFYIFEKTEKKSLLLISFLVWNRRSILRETGIKKTVRLIVNILNNK
ncbi:Putative glycosyltransferase EpsE [Chryseobacterium aquaeductus]|uniref:Glycosyltransferase EpsE n=1 Tax=Chryseobacterium aquaeductus TaxID=2675056 RepID=A0A9N8MFY5_9FLAO|nr:glycosyltransferase [Chryseobacterium aquaeductus]CAA7330483.1 Putative glycosyltransferase EpsE [Chryseobacterium potabilaquae]CAD7803951.1 Putative glycosyltransferase EpsE [Chryseobacterium aquaeductus]